MPNHVVLVADGVPALLAYRDGAGSWQELPARSGEHDLCVTHDYEVVGVCAYDGLSYAEHTATTFTEDPEVTAPRCAPTAATTVRVSVDVQTAGWVFLADYGEARSSVPWTFERHVRPGIYDLFAISYPTGTENARVLIRRDLHVSTSTSLPPLNLATEGEATIQVPLTVAGVMPDDRVGTSVYWATGPDDYALISETRTTTAFVVPSSLLEADDEQGITVRASSAGQSRRASTRGPDFVTSLTLPPPLTDINYTDGSILTASWTDFPLINYGRIRLTVDGPGDVEDPTRRHQGVTATRGWLEARGASSLAFADVPAYKAEWVIDLSKTYLRGFEVIDESTNVTFGSGTYDTVNATTTAGPSPSATDELGRAFTVHP